MKHWKLAAVSGRTPALEVRDSVRLIMDQDIAIELLHDLAEALHRARRDGEITVKVFVAGELDQDRN